MKIAYLGLGNMGSSIARNLLRAGHDLTVYNRSREKAEALTSDGARVVDSPAEAARDAEVIMTMLSNDQAVEAVVFGKDGAASTLKKGAVHISNSTISAAFARHLAKEHSNREQGFLSAPVFGRPEAAAAKKLIVVTAGETALVERYKPLFDAIGRQTYIAGSEPWQANVVKLGGNFMIASMMEAFGETFALMRKSGIDHHLFFEVMVELFGSPVYKNYGALIADEKFEPAGFALNLGFKDVRLVLEASQEVSSPMPLASLLRDSFIEAIAHGQEGFDWSSIAKVSARRAGLP